MGTEKEEVATFSKAICCPVCGDKPPKWKAEWHDAGMHDDPMDWYECGKCHTHFGVAGRW